MTLILDAGGISGLAADRARLDALRRRGLWPPRVPAVVLTENSPVTTAVTTSDPTDLTALAEAASRTFRVVAV